MKYFGQLKYMYFFKILYIYFVPYFKSTMIFKIICHAQNRGYKISSVLIKI